MPGAAGRTLGDVGEFGLVAAVTARLPQGPGVLLGPGDDAAVVAAPDGRVVVTTDLLVQDRHFRLEWSSARDVGHKAAAQNLADVAAMGARPVALVVGLAAPAALPVAWASALADGLRAECDRVGASVVGGDVVAADVVTVAATALGDLGGREPVTRAGARPGDVVVLAGRLGLAEAGLELLRAGLVGPPAALAAHRRPRPPYPLGPALARAGATAMVDVSDGLLADLGHVATASGVRIDLDPAALPLPRTLRAAAAALGVDPLGWVLTGGEDHALVATLPPSCRPPAGCRVVGRVLPGVGVTVGGVPRPGPPGHDHFPRPAGGGT